MKLSLDECMERVQELRRMEDVLTLVDNVDSAHSTALVTLAQIQHGICTLHSFIIFNRLGHANYDRVHLTGDDVSTLNAVLGASEEEDKLLGYS